MLTVLFPLGFFIVLFTGAPGLGVEGTSAGNRFEARPYAPERRYFILGSLPARSPRGAVVLYDNTQVCDPNDVNFVTFDGLLQSGLIQNCLTNGNRMGCSGVCPPAGPLYFQDSGTTIAADATGFSLACGSDQATGPFDIDVCFWAGTSTEGALGTPIVQYTLVGVPPDTVGGDDQVALITVNVDLTTTPPTWTADRPLDSMTFSGLLLKNKQPLNSPDVVPMPGGRFGISVGEPTGLVEDAGVVRAHGGNGNVNDMRALDGAPECMVNCGEIFTPDLTFLFIDPNNNNCTFDNCVNCPIDQASVFFQITALQSPGEPNNTIDPLLPAVITDGGCYTDFSFIDDPLDVDMYRVAVPAVPPEEGLQLAVYADGEAGSTGNPLLRVFKEDGTELAVNDSDGRPFDEDMHPETDPRGEAHCPPRPGINALVSVRITAPGNYYVAVSGGGCDAWDDVNCAPDPTGTCNDDYDPFVANSGTPGTAGLYNVTIGLGSLAPIGDEPNDNIPLASPVTNIGLPGSFSSMESGFMGDGPFGACLGDFDYWRIPGAELTPGNALDIEVVSNFVGHETSSFMMVYEKVGVEPHTLVAVNDNTLGSRDSRCLVPVRAGADYYVMVMPVGIPPQDIDGCFRQFGGFSDYEPGLDQMVPGAGDAIPGALGQPNFEGPYELRVTETPLPPATGPFEPNDSLAEASANARINVVNNTIVPVSVTAVLGDGRYGWSIGSGGPVGDTDLFELTGLATGGTVECTASPHATNTSALFIAFFEGNRMHDWTDIRLIFTTGGLTAQLLSSIPATGPYYTLVTSDDDRVLSNIGNFLPWDVTIPGTLLSGQFSGPYVLSVLARTPPPTARPLSRMFGASRGDRSTDILGLDPDTGQETTAIPAPAVVNGAATGLAINPTRSVLYYMNGPDIGGTGNMMWELDPDTGDVLHSTNLTLDPFIRQTSGGTQNIDGSLDGLGWAGQHLWMCLQNVARVYRWNPSTRVANLTLTAQSMGLTSFRDGLDGTDQSNLGTGHMIYVAARNNRVITVIDVGAAGNGPGNNGLMQLLGTITDPTYPGGPGISNNGGMAVLRTIGRSPFQNLYSANINATLLHVVDADPAAQGAIVGGWIYPDFGCSGLTGWSAVAGDFDSDGDVDLADFVTFQLCFGGSSNPPAATCPPGADADLDGDGDVDLADFLIFQQSFTGSR